VTVWSVASQDWCHNPSNQYWRVLFQSDSFKEAQDFYKKYWGTVLSENPSWLLGEFAYQHTLALGVLEDCYTLDTYCEKDWVVPDPCNCGECQYHQYLDQLVLEAEAEPSDPDLHFEELLPANW